MNSNKTVEQLIQDEKREYFREWRAKNKDKVKQHNQNYWKRKAEKRLQESKNKGV